MVFLSIWIATLAAILYLAFTPRTTERVIWSLCICLAVIVGETYYGVTDERLSISALEAMWDPSLFTLDILAFYGSYFLKALVSVAFLLVGLLIPPPPIELLRWRGLIATPFAPFLAVCGLIYYVGAGQTSETRGMPSQFLLPGVLSIYALSDLPQAEKSEVEIPISESLLPENIILIVDESVSGDFIDLNVARGTTPFLVSQADSIANFGLALSASNCSNSSNAILRLGANPHTLGAGDNNILSNPSIWKYAKYAGYESNFIEAQNISERHENFLDAAEIELIDNVLSYAIDTERSQRDTRLIEQIGEVLARENRQFLYVNKYGAHFPYHHTYPDDKTVFRPTMQPGEPIADKARLVNSYKNAIHWSVDRFFARLFDEVDLSKSVLIYTSDHGQNLLDDGKPSTHCRRQSNNLFEAVVPLLVWSGDEELRRKFRTSATLNKNAASHFEIFPTILQLFGFDSTIVRLRYHQNLFEKTQTPMGSTTGPVIGRFGNHIVWHSREGLDRLRR